MSEQSAPANQVLSLPQGGGAVQGIGETFQPNLFSGTGNFTVPIAISPGRAGFGPQLSLQYSTGNGNGAFGLGWQLSIPNITRKTEKGLPKYDDDDMFVMSGAEDLVPVLHEDGDRWIAEDPVPRGAYTATRYRPRTEGLFARIEKWVHNDTRDVHWRATTKDNVTSVYGRTAAARIFDPDKPAHIYQWLLQETFDAKGNHILYEYAREEQELSINEIQEQHRDYRSQRYLRRIYYGNTPDSLSADKRVGPTREARHYLFEVVFDYGDLSNDPTDAYVGTPDEVETATPNWFLREDRFSHYRAGFEIRTLRRCERVLMFHHFDEPGVGAGTLVKSTDFAYRTNADTLVSILESATVSGYRREGDGFRTAALPPVTFAYSEFRPHKQRYQSVTAEGGDLPPLALNNPDFTLVDLFGSGLPDVLHTMPQGFRYWKNLGNGHFDRPHPMHETPVGVTLSQTGVGFADMAGDGRADLLVADGPIQGFFETTPEDTWETFHPIPDLPSVGLSDPNTRLTDLTGDGLTDILMTLDHHFLWFQCLGEAGYADPQFVERIHDLDEFPDVFFNDPSDRVRLADMSGDGLNDIVLIHNGRIDYWPNLGYGHFGKRVTMAKAPRLEHNFDPARLFLADLDGSGCADLVYVDFNQVYFWFNRSGNSWSKEQPIPGTPMTTNATALQFADFFGTGTTALVWSNDFGQHPGGNYKVLDFCGGVKPYLLIEMDNNMGATTRVQYAPSTKFYLEDEAKGDTERWATKLPFPVQVVEKTEVIDHISKSKLVTRYSYHHGFYDGREREFRGFGRVDQLDTEIFKDFHQAGLHGAEAAFDNGNEAFHVPPVLTRNWFHTGAFLEQKTLMQRYRAQYWNYLDDLNTRDDPLAFDLGEHQFSKVEPDSPPGHQAHRALRGSLLRSEVYALDNTEKASLPYVVTENTFHVKELQPTADNPYAVFLTTPLETLTYHYERNPHDPRITHSITLKVNDFGNVTDSVSIGYPRRRPQEPVNDDNDQPIVDADGLPLAPFAEHLVPKATYTHIRFINKSDEPNLYYVGIPVESKAFEIHGLDWTWPDARQSRIEPVKPFSRDHFMALDNPHDFAPFAPDPPDAIAAPTKRIIEWSRTYFRQDSAADKLDSDESGTLCLALGDIDSLALPCESYQAALTDDLMQRIYNEEQPGTTRVSDAMLQNDGGYVRLQDADGYWWMPSGRQAFKPDGFYQAHQARDPFGDISLTTYDDYCLLFDETQDPLENTIQAVNDYRVLQPGQIVDPNGNHAFATFDALGLVVGTAVQSREGEGDSLDDFRADLTPDEIHNYFDRPLELGPALLGSATTRIIYDLHARPTAAESLAPPVASTLARETHMSDLQPGETSNIQYGFLYSDGFGRELQTKVQAEPSNDNGSSVEHRWVGTGSVVYNNKGKPVRQFEPVFSDTHRFGIEKHGVSPMLFYDPLERIVCTLHPNLTYEKVVFDPWHQEAWDVNDTVVLKTEEDEIVTDPRQDPDVGKFFANLDTNEFLPTWYTRHIGADLNSAEQDAARKALAHAGTPTVTNLDTLGRAFLTVADDGTPEKVKTHVQLDIEGIDRVITDPRGIEAFVHDVDMAGRKLRIDSKDAGVKHVLPDVTNNPVYTWDANGNRVQVVYDALRRPMQTWVYRGAPHNDMILNQVTLYGERLSNPEIGNHRGRVFAILDGAGVAVSKRYDFKGNLKESARYLAREYREDLDWQALDVNRPVAEIEQELEPLLEPEVFHATSRFDALNRVTEATAPDHRQVSPGDPVPEDGSVYRYSYNKASLLEKVEVKLRSETGAGSSFMTFVENIDYNAKGQRERIDYGNGVVTRYTYEPDTFRLATMISRKTNGTRLQDLRYTYDPAGNITRIHDAALPTVFNHNDRIDPISRYSYDPLYRLTEATGRVHEVMTPCNYRKGAKKQTEFIKLSGQPINNGMALLNYTQTYNYDPAGNLTEIKHTNKLNLGWTRIQTYAADTNRMITSRAGCDGEDRPIAHDASGNISQLHHMKELVWDYANRLREVELNTVTNRSNDHAYYMYDANGQRMRKVIEHGEQRAEERIYLGAFEIYRKYNNSRITLERQTLHVMDDQKRIALVETRTDDPAPFERRFRYQLDNRLGSSILEVDQTSEANEISYEEYYPYGGTAYLAGKSWTEVKEKRYRYSGKERDDETGLYYYGARYYAPWLGRWMSSDPIGREGGENLFRFVANNPIYLRDLRGLQGIDQLEGESRRIFQRLCELEEALRNADERLSDAIEENVRTEDELRTAETSSTDPQLSEREQKSASRQANRARRRRVRTRRNVELSGRAGENIRNLIDQAMEEGRQISQQLRLIAGGHEEIEAHLSQTERDLARLEGRTLEVPNSPEANRANIVAADIEISLNRARRRMQERDNMVRGVRELADAAPNDQSVRREMVRRYNSPGGWAPIRRMWRQITRWVSKLKIGTLANIASAGHTFHTTKGSVPYKALVTGASVTPLPGTGGMVDLETAGKGVGFTMHVVAEEPLSLLLLYQPVTLGYWSGYISYKAVEFALSD